MKQVILPQELGGTENSSGANSLLINHRSFAPSVKSQIVLDWHLFSFLQVGEKQVSFPTGNQTISPDKFLFLPAGNCLMSEKISKDGLYESLLFFVKKSTLSELLKEISPDSLSEPTQTPNGEPIAIKNDEYIRNFVAGLKIVCDSQVMVQDSRFNKLKLEELISYLIKKEPTLYFYFKNLSDEMEEDVKLRKIVSLHMETALTVEEFAFLCNMSTSTFKRRFFKIYGDSPRQWLLKMRMKKAVDLLTSQGLKPSEIYHQVGYENFSSFVQSFKAIYGVTPKQFKMQQ